MEDCLKPPAFSCRDVKFTVDAGTATIKLLRHQRRMYIRRVWNIMLQRSLNHFVIPDVHSHQNKRCAFYFSSYALQCCGRTNGPMFM